VCDECVAACRTLAPSGAERIAELAERSLVLEIRTYPKPGLVSHVDTGSHADMDAATFARSAAVLRPYFAELAEAGARDADMGALRKIGLRAEHAMLAATGGVNTHRGAIFGLGLLCAAAGRRATADAADAAARTMTLGAFVARRWGARSSAARGCRTATASARAVATASAARAASRPAARDGISRRLAGVAARRALDAGRRGSRARRSLLRADRRARRYEPAASRRARRLDFARAAHAHSSHAAASARATGGCAPLPRAFVARRLSPAARPTCSR
jgi:triphosphoribosyl-dephospho-CoA synthase